MDKPEQSFPGLFAMSFANLGTAIAFALQQGNMARVFQTLGADLDQLPILMIAGPVTGLLLQPLVGHYSDRHWGWLGRRRPFFFVGAVLAGLALFGMAHVRTLLAAALLLWVLDAALNVAIEPFRAFVADMTPLRQRARGLAFMAGLGCVGAIAGFALPFALAGLDVANTAPPGQIPPSVQMALTLSGLITVAAVSWTVFSTREYSPAEMAAFAGPEAEPEAAAEELVPPVHGASWLAAGLALSALVAACGLDIQFHVISLSLAGFGLLQLVNRRWPRQGALGQILSDLAAMPMAMRKLAAIHFFTWFALFIMWPFMTPVVTQYVFHAPDPASAAYNAGADWVGLLFVAFNLAAVAMSFFALPGLARRFGEARTHAACLAIGAFSYAAILVLRNRYALFVPFLGLGIAWAALLSLPYVMLTRVIPARKFGVYIGIFNFFIVLPQMLGAAGMGPLLRAWFPHQPIWTMAFAAGSMGIAAVLTAVLKPDRD